MATAKQGWLLKQSKGLGSSWKKKYVVLQANLLLVFDKEPVFTFIVVVSVIVTLPNRAQQVKEHQKAPTM